MDTWKITGCDMKTFEQQNDLGSSGFGQVTELAPLDYKNQEEDRPCQTKKTP